MSKNLFCRECGEQLEKIKANTHFDRKTGEAISTNFFQCSKHNEDPRHDSINENEVKELLKEE